MFCRSFIDHGGICTRQAVAPTSPTEIQFHAEMRFCSFCSFGPSYHFGYVCSDVMCAVLKKLGECASAGAGEQVCKRVCVSVVFLKIKNVKEKATR